MNAVDLIGLDAVRLLREHGLVVVHQTPTESMVKAGFSTGQWPEDRGVVQEFHRMITRAQAEALLTLAESLEACERLALFIHTSYDGPSLFYGSKYTPLSEVNAVQIRLALSYLVPKSET